MGALAVWAVQQSFNWKTARRGSKRIPTIVFAARPLITPALPSSAAFLVIRCGLKACRSFTSIRSSANRFIQGRGQRPGVQLKLRSRPVQVEPDRMLHALIAQLDRPRLH